MRMDSGWRRTWWASLLPPGHGWACPGHPPPAVAVQMAGTRPAMTIERRPCSASLLILIRMEHRPAPYRPDPGGSGLALVAPTVCWYMDCHTDFKLGCRIGTVGF